MQSSSEKYFLLDVSIIARKIVLHISSANSYKGFSSNVNTMLISKE